MTCSAAVALSLACLVFSCSASQASPAASGDDELSLLQVTTEAEASLLSKQEEYDMSLDPVPSKEQFDKAKELVAKYEHAEEVAKHEEEVQMEEIKEKHKQKEMETAENLKAKAKAESLKAAADEAQKKRMARTTKCPTTTTPRVTTTSTSTYKPLPASAWVAYTSADVTNSSQAYDYCFDPLIDDQRGFTLDLFISNLPDQDSAPQHDGTVIASKFQQDPARGMGKMGWALIYHKKGLSQSFGMYKYPWIEFQVAAGGQMVSTRQYLPADKTTHRITVSYNGPHYKRVRIYVNQEEHVDPPALFPQDWIGTLSPQDLPEEMIPATTGCLSVQKISPDIKETGAAAHVQQHAPSWSQAYQGTVGGITLYQGQVTLAHLRDYYMAS